MASVFAYLTMLAIYNEYGLGKQGLKLPAGEECLIGGRIGCSSGSMKCRYSIVVLKSEGKRR
jgi:hypothetical protein